MGLLRRAAETSGSRMFLRAPDGDVSFSGFYERVLRRAGGFKEQGVARHQLVVIRLPAGVRFLEAWFGVIAIGAVPVPIAPNSSQRELEYAVSDAGAQWLVDRNESSSARPARLLRQIDSESVEVAPATGSEPASIVYTSGTSGMPKGVVIRHQAYVWAGESYPAWLGLNSSDHIWTCLPPHHVNHQAYSVMGALAWNLPLTITDRFSATTFWAEAARLGVTATNLVGGMAQFIADRAGSALTPHRLRIIYAAPAGSPRFRKEFEARFRTKLITGYAMSESVFGCIEGIHDDPLERCIGRPREHPKRLFVNEMEIRDASGECLGENELGEITIRNPAITPGYWNAPEQTAERLVDGWLRTGDLGFRDSENRFFLVGRLKEIIRRKGENIAPVEVEEVLLEHPAVREVAVIGVQADHGEEEVHAFVATDEDVDPTALRGWCAERLSAFKVPDVFTFLPELPKTATMRIAKHALRAE